MQEFAAPSLLRPSVLEHSSFRSTDSSSTGSPHQGNYLLSDLGGEIHEPGRGSSALEFGDRAAPGVGDAAASRVGFGYPGSLRSPSSRMFDRGQDAARSLAFPRPRNYSGTPRSIGGLVHDQDVDAASDQARPMRTSSSSFDMGTVVTTTGLLYSGDSSSASSGLSAAPFLGHSSEDPFFGSAPISNWPPHTASSNQPRKKVLSTPPGLSPPGLGRLDSPLSQLTAESDTIGGVPGGRGSQFDAKMDSSSAFDPFKSTSIGGSIGPFGGADSRPLGGNSGRIGSHLSRLNLSSDTFAVTSPQRRQEASLVHGGVSNRDLAELNTQSVKMDDLAPTSDMPSDSSPTRSPWQDTSSARRIEVQAKPKTGRSAQQPARERRRTETSLGIRGSSPLPLATNTANSPLRVQTSVDQRPSAASPSPSQGSSSSDVAAPSGETQPAESSSASKGRRRHHASGATPKSSSYAVVVGGAAAGSVATVSGADSRKKAHEPDSSNESALRSATAETSEFPPAKSTAARDGAKAKRKDPVGESKSGSKAQPSKKNAARGAADKGASAASSSSTTATATAAVSRRQVYREKQKVSAKDVEKAAVEGSQTGGSSAGSPDVKLYPAKELKTSTDEPKPEAKSRRRRQRDTKELKQSDSMSPSKSTSEPAEGNPNASSPPVRSEASKKASEPAVSAETVATSFADVVASNKKQQKTTKKEASTETPSELSASRTTATSTIEASGVASKAVKTPPVDESLAQNLALDTPSVSHLEPTENKETSPDTLPQQQKVDIAAGVTVEQEESSNAVSNDGSSSDIDKTQLSTDDEFEVVPRHHRDGTTSADESSAPAPAAHTSSSHETKRADRASKKSAVKDKDHRKEKQKKEKTDRKKSSKHKKDKRSPPTAGSSNNTDGAQPDDPLATLPSDLGTSNAPSMSTRALAAVKTAAVWTGTTAVAAVVAALALWKQFVERANLKGGLATAFSYVESVLAVVFSVVLLLALHGASWFIRVHRVAFRALLSHRHIGFCFAFLYGFPALVHHIFPWAPPWAPVCLWYAFLVQLFCTNGPTAMMTTFRIILPLVFLVEGISHHSFLLDLNGNILRGDVTLPSICRVLTLSR